MTQVTLCLVAPAYVIEQRTGFCPVRCWVVGLNTAQAEWLGQKEKLSLLPPPGSHSHQGCHQRETVSGFPRRQDALWCPGGSGKGSGCPKVVRLPEGS